MCRRSYVRSSLTGRPRRVVESEARGSEKFPRLTGGPRTWDDYPEGWTVHGTGRDAPDWGTPTSVLDPQILVYFRNPKSQQVGPGSPKPPPSLG